MRSIIVAAALAMGLAGCAAGPAGADSQATHVAGEPALRLHGFRESFEIAPVLLAAEEHFPPGLSIWRGGIPNLVGAAALPNYGDPGRADVATHAETQLLRYSLAHPNLRVIMTVTEGDYRLLARRSAGVERIADLRGKKIATLPHTSAGYFLHKMLATEGMTLADVQVVGDLELTEMGEALASGAVDALAIWEPEAEEAALALGSDAVNFSGEGIYREIFNLNTTAENLADPEKRGLIKQLLGGLLDAGDRIRRDPTRAQALVGRMSGHPPDLIAAAWPHHRYLTGKVHDLVEVLVEQEQWLAARDGRAPRGRAELARLIDYSLLDEVLSERATSRDPVD